MPFESPDQLDAGGDPPRIAEDGLDRPRFREEIAVGEVVEEGERRIYLHHPVWLHKDDGANKDTAAPLGHERLDLHPGDDIVQAIGYVKTCSGNRQPPSVRRVRPEQVIALPSSKQKLDACDLSQLAETMRPGTSTLLEARTSSKINLWRRTPLRIFAIVITIMTTNAPITT